MQPIQQAFEPVSICFASDDNYAPYLKVAIYSLLCNRNRERSYDIIILHKRISREHQGEILGLADGKSGVSIRFVNVVEADRELQSDVGCYYAVETNYRLLLFSKLFQNYRRMLYLDCDIIVTGDVGELFDVDLEGKSAAGVEYRGMTLEPWYHLDITNLETVSMFSNMFKGWFAPVASNYNEFIRALLEGNVKAMNLYMNDVALATFSSFDVGKYVSERTQPERFYHGFVLGLLIEIRDRYDVRSNRESGFGRYDVIMVPKNIENSKLPALILEFKVINSSIEKSLEETVQAALKQIKEKKYDTELLKAGVKKERIRHYGFAFEGKRVLIGGE